MGNLYNKTNAPYLIAGTLATLALLASGTLAVAPYVAFLSPIAAFNVALPVALSLSILSTLILALSCKMISRNKKLAAQGAELNEKTELAAEQENTIQSLEPQIKGLNKKVSDLETKLDEISKQTNGAATKDAVKKLIEDAVEKLKKELEAGLNGAAKDAVKKLIEDAAEELKKELEVKIGNAATKDAVKKLIEDAVEKLKKELEVKIGNAATKDAVEERLSSQYNEIEELKAGLNGAAKDAVKKLIEDAAEELKKELEVKIDSAATKDEVKKLIEDAVEERLSSLIKEVEVKEELQMKFYEKGKKRYKTTFDDVILPNDIKQRLVRIYQPNALEKREGYILYGPPGTGKTMIARAIASETKGKSAFISVSGSSLFNIQNINDLFKKAKENAPCIVFIDEIEGFGKACSSDDNIRYLKHFLTKIDGSDHVKGVTVIAATNHIGILDEALIRGGRLSTHIKISTLDTDARKKIIDEYCQKKNLRSIAYTILNNTSEGFSPANLINLLEKIAEAHCEKKVTVTQIATICRDFKKTHNIDKVSNKKNTTISGNGSLSGPGNSSVADSSKRLSGVEKSITDGDSSQSYTSTPKTKETSTKKPLNLPESPIMSNNSTEGERNSSKENKENSGPQNQRSPHTSFSSSHSSPLRDATNNSIAF